MITLTVGDNKSINLESDAIEMNANGFLLHNDNKTLTYSGASGTYTVSKLTVPSGKDYKVILDDGSIISLNSASTLEFPMKFHGSKREIRITGEAYLKIAKNTHPFIVHMPQGSDVQVLGTEFNVNTYDNGIIKVALVEGSVKINAGGNSEILKPGNAATFAGKGITVNIFNQQEVLDWQKGIFRFPVGVTIDEIARVVPRYSGIKMIVDKSATGKIFKGIVYNRNKPIDELLFQITATKEITSYMQDEVIHLK
jgi:ferric-dicitrate binding protein FerR (iron transport regulator)